MKSVFNDCGVQAGLVLSGVLLATAVVSYSVLFAVATHQVLQLDLRHMDPLKGMEYYGEERQPNGNLQPVLVRSVLDIRNVPASVAESHHCDRVTNGELQSSTLPDLIVASEDRRFRRHSGVDFIATLPRLLRGKGASTITMQLARSTALQTLAFPIFRKPYEWALAGAWNRTSAKR